MYKFDYFYGNEAEQYQFYMIPQLLFTDNKFKKLSSDAKILYSLLLDRSGLSFKNQDKFQDENGRTFIFFKQESAMEMLNCAKEKITKIFKELDDIGLIERKRQGLGKPTKIYVKHFNRLIETEDTPNDNKIELQEVRKSNFKTFENRTSSSSEIEPQEVRKSNTNQTYNNQTNIIHTEFNQTASTSENFSQSNYEKKDRQTDRQINNKSINEILCDIGYTGKYLNGEIFNDENGLTNTMVIYLKECSIPSEYHKDKTSLRKALNIFVQWNYAYNGFKEQKDKELYSHIVETIFSFLIKDTTRFKERNISYTYAFDCLNKKIHTHGELYSWIVLAMDEWKSVVSRTNIKNVTAYMKMCVWNWLESSELEVKNNADSYISQKNCTNNYRPYYYNRSKDLYAEAASRPQSYDLAEFEKMAINYCPPEEESDDN